jgi:hypothetical protein
VKKVAQWKKSTVRDFFGPILTKMVENWFIEIYGKTAPTKSTVLGGDPPLGIFNKIYRFLPFFWFFRPAFEPHKPSPKAPFPADPPSEDPQKVIFFEIYRFLTIFDIFSPRTIKVEFITIYHLNHFLKINNIKENKMTL